jgi:hypothetical protein
VADLLAFGAAFFALFCGGWVISIAQIAAGLMYIDAR